MDTLMNPEDGAIARFTRIERSIANIGRWVRWGIPILVTIVLALEGYRVEQQRVFVQIVHQDVVRTVNTTVPAAVQRSVPGAVQQGIKKCLSNVPNCAPGTGVPGTP